MRCLCQDGCFSSQTSDNYSNHPVLFSFIIWAAHLHCWTPANTFPGLSASMFCSLDAQCAHAFSPLWLWWWFGHKCLRQRWFLNHPMRMIKESADSAFSRLVYWPDTESSHPTRTLLFNLLWTGRSWSDWKLVSMCRLGPFAQVSTDSFHPNGPLQEYLVTPEAATRDHKLKSNSYSVANSLLLHHHITMISAGDGETEYRAWMRSFTSCYGQSCLFAATESSWLLLQGLIRKDHHMIICLYCKCLWSFDQPSYQATSAW